MTTDSNGRIRNGNITSVSHQTYTTPHYNVQPSVENEIKLSDILNSAPRFSAFDELISIPTIGSTALKISQHDLFKIHKIIEDIHVYLSELLSLFSSLQRSDLSLDSDLNWYYEGKDSVAELTRNMESIDAIISQLLVIIEADVQASISGTLLSKFEESSDLLLDVKKHIIIYKKNMDISINYREIKDSIIRCLSQEIEECIKVFLRLQKMKLSSPKRVLPKFDLEQITAKMRINDLSTTNNLSMRSMRLPTTNEFDDALYNEYLDLESRIRPLEVSLDILPMKIEEFDHSCSGVLFPGARKEIAADYKKLLNQWNYLQNELRQLKKESLDSKWLEIFRYLVEEITAKCNAIIKELKTHGNDNSRVTDEVGATYKLCSNCITLIHKAFQEGIIYDSTLVALFNDSLLSKWEIVNNMLTNPGYVTTHSKGSPIKSGPYTAGSRKSFDENGLKIFHTSHRSDSPSATNDKAMNNGYGIDLGVDVESSSVPFSIRKEDKVRDIFGSSNRPKLSTKNLKFTSLKIINTQTNNERELDSSPFSSTPVTPVKSTVLTNQETSKSNGYGEIRAAMDDLRINEIPVRKEMKNVGMYFTAVLSEKHKFPSKIPLQVPNFHELNIPVLKKKYTNHELPTKIPGICPSHPIFHSPVHRRTPRRMTPAKRHRNVSFTGLGSPIRTVPFADDDIGLSSSRLSKISTDSSRSRNSSIGSGGNSRPTSLLTELRVPNLSYTSPASINSTSPERPLSSLGSRFDEAHLLQSGKEIKPNWNEKRKLGFES
ncbi:karyogamy protein [Scheffersomyces xylosifermentans]|uniref:karyogamy protein n=1 Tax=Scheffersomyces xylosifermentans TaxID=1304137 RepID=UPI00315DA377